MAIITPLLFAFNNRKHISASVTASLLLNILISTIFVIVRKTPGICEYMPYHEVNSFDGNISFDKQIFRVLNVTLIGEKWKRSCFFPVLSLSNHDLLYLGIKHTQPLFNSLK